MVVTVAQQLDQLDLTALTTQDSATRPTLLWEINWAGFGAMMSRIQVGFGIALAHGYNVSFRMAGCRYVYPFDLPLQSLTTAELAARTTFKFLAGAEQSKVAPAGSGVQVWNFETYWDTDWSRQYQNPALPAGRLGWLGQAPTRHQWAARIIKHITARPNAALTELVAQTKTQLQWPNGPVIGVHIRHGDKATESPLLPVAIYVDYLKRIIAKHWLIQPSIFVTSDDPAVQAELVELASKEQLITRPEQILYDATEIRYNDFNCLRVAQQPHLISQESLTAAKNILLLGQCDYVLGTHNAQFGLLGGLLAVANHGYQDHRHYLIDANNSQRLHHWDTILSQGNSNTLPEW